MIEEIIMYVCLGIIVGLFVDYGLFKWWHHGAHSDKFRAEEKEQKEKEGNIRFDNWIGEEDNNGKEV